MSGKTNAVSLTDRRSARRAASQAEILDAAWLVVRERGLAGLSMRDLGERVGMRAQSVYSYFAAKDDIYDAMFRQACEEQLAWMSEADVTDADGNPLGGDAVAHLRLMAHRFFSFCTSDPVRYQLLFQRTIPGFQPSAASYEVALAALDQLRAGFARAGITDADAADLATALLTGLTSQQLANDPGGSRWERLVDRAVLMLLREVAPHLLDQPTRPGTINGRKR